MTTRDEDRDTPPTPTRDPFPQPQTIPSGWDLSGILAPPESDAALDDEAPAGTHPTEY